MSMVPVAPGPKPENTVKSAVPGRLPAAIRSSPATLKGDSTIVFTRKVDIVHKMCERQGATSRDRILVLG